MLGWWVHKLVWCLSSVSSQQFSLITKSLRVLCLLSMGDRRLSRPGSTAPLPEASSWAELSGVTTFVQQAKLFSCSPWGRRMRSGHPRQWGRCFAEAPCCTEYKQRNWDMTFSDREGICWWWMNLSLTLGCVVGEEKKKKRQILSAVEIKIPPSSFYPVTPNKCSACF